MDVKTEILDGGKDRDTFKERINRDTYKQREKVGRERKSWPLTFQSLWNCS